MVSPHAKCADHVLTTHVPVNASQCVSIPAEDMDSREAVAAWTRHFSGYRADLFLSLRPKDADMSWWRRVFAWTSDNSSTFDLWRNNAWRELVRQHFAPVGTPANSERLAADLVAVPQLLLLEEVQTFVLGALLTRDEAFLATLASSQRAMARAQSPRPAQQEAHVRVQIAREALQRFSAPRVSELEAIRQVVKHTTIPGPDDEPIELGAGQARKLRHKLDRYNDREKAARARFFRIETGWILDCPGHAGKLDSIFHGIPFPVSVTRELGVGKRDPSKKTGMPFLPTGVTKFVEVGNHPPRSHRPVAPVAKTTVRQRKRRA